MALPPSLKVSGLSEAVNCGNDPVVQRELSSGPALGLHTIANALSICRTCPVQVFVMLRSCPQRLFESTNFIVCVWGFLGKMIK